MELKPEEISKIIREQIKHYDSAIRQSETGVVILIGDGIIGSTAAVSRLSASSASRFRIPDTAAIEIIARQNGRKRKIYTRIADFFGSCAVCSGFPGILQPAF